MTNTWRPAPSRTTFLDQMADYARGERLRELRERRRMSQEHVAGEVGVSTKTVWSWEHGGKIKWANAQRIAAFYGMDPEELVTRDLADTPDMLGTLNGNGPALSLEERLDEIDRKLDELLRRLPAQDDDVDPNAVPDRLPGAPGEDAQQTGTEG